MQNFLSIKPSQTRRRLPRGGTTVAFAISLVSLTSCQLYQSSPLDPSAHAEGWRDRSPSDEQVRDFARRIETTAPRSVPFNPGDGLTLAEAELVALVYNPDLRLARLKAGVAKASAEHAGRWDDPKLSIDVSRSRRCSLQFDV